MKIGTILRTQFCVLILEGTGVWSLWNVWRQDKNCLDFFFKQPKYCSPCASCSFSIHLHQIKLSFQLISQMFFKQSSWVIKPMRPQVLSGNLSSFFNIFSIYFLAFWILVWISTQNITLMNLIIFHMMIESRYRSTQGVGLPEIKSWSPAGGAAGWCDRHLLGVGDQFHGLFTNLQSKLDKSPLKLNFQRETAKCLPASRACYRRNWNTACARSTQKCLCFSFGKLQSVSKCQSVSNPFDTPPWKMMYVRPDYTTTTTSSRPSTTVQLQA